MGQDSACLATSTVLPALVAALRGKTCASMRLVRHRFREDPPSEVGPIELGWSDGTFTTLDANADWTLDLTSRPWVDPYAQAGVDERQELAVEVGLWEPTTPTGDLEGLVGRSVTSAEPILNEAGELSGLELAFGDVTLLAAVEAGNLVVQVRGKLD